MTVSLDLNAQAGTAVDQGNLLGLVSGYTRSDGSVHRYAGAYTLRRAVVDGATAEQRGLARELAARFPGDADALYPGWREKLGV